jgi:hypothetical protein
LELEFCTRWFEQNGKLRGIEKAQYITADHDFIYNGLSDMDGVEVDLIHLQDGIKADVLYAWLMVIGNTVFTNHRAGGTAAATVADLYEMAQKINVKITGSAQEYLVIEAVSVVAGLYSELQVAFESKFGRYVWTNWCDAAHQGRMLWELTQSRVAMGDWYPLDVTLLSNLGVMEDLYPGLDLIAFSDMQFAGLDLSDPAVVQAGFRANILVFAMNDDNIVSYLQRSYGFMGLPGCPVYNVELYESSTVGEGIGTSRQMANSVRVAETCIPEGADVSAVIDQQFDWTAQGRQPIMQAKLLSSFADGHWFGKQAVAINVNEETKSLYLSEKALVYIDSLLAAHGLNRMSVIVAKDKMFAKVCEALSRVVFVFTGKGKSTSMWMPGLYNLGLINDSSDNLLTLSDRFVGILRGILQGQVVDAVQLNMVRGTLDSLIASRNTIKLIAGAGEYPLQARISSLHPLWSDLGCL